MEYVLKSTGELVRGKSIKIKDKIYPEQAFAKLPQLLPVRPTPSIDHETQIIEFNHGQEIDGEWVRFQVRDKTAEEIAQDTFNKRAGAYPDIGDQLDDLFKQGAFSDEMAAKIQAVKDAYPKA
jgi:hypothetical protein